jgi:Domain of unknown function (DUF5134)
MTGVPSWLAGALAGLMILVAAVAAGRLVCWLRARRAEADADALHVLTGIAMAGMFEPAIGVLPTIAWQVVFAAGAAWFTWQAARRRGGTGAVARHSHPAAHVVECGAMLYVLWPTAGRRSGMPGMAGHAGLIPGNPAIALVLAVGMLGYLLWAIDQLLSPARRPARASAPADRARVPADLARVPAAGGDGEAPPLGRPADLHQERARGTLLAPRLAAWQKITMGLAMGYMLVTML